MVFPTSMALWLVSLLLLLAIAVVAESSSGDAAHWGLTRFEGGDGGLDTSHMCDGLVGKCIDDEEEMTMDSEISRRGLMAAQHGRFISYRALVKNRVPCNRRGHSYYNCQRGGRANPYRRGCSVITRCARNVH